jgi:hypothetical protein
MSSYWTSALNFLLYVVDSVWNVMAHAQKPDFVFRRNGRVHLNRQGRQFSRLLAAEVCASVVVMLDTPRSEVMWRVLATHSIRQFPLHFPCRASPCAITFERDSTKEPLLWQWHLLLWMHCATNRKFAGSIPEGVPELFSFGIFLPAALWTFGSTQPLTEMSIRNISWGVKAAIGLITLPTSCSDCLEIYEPQLPGKRSAYPGLYRDWFTLYFWM